MIPIFVGGVGRSGTGIVNTCLLRHPHVKGRTGEFRWCRPDNQIAIPTLDLDYVKHVADRHFAEAEWWVEKSPENAAHFDQLLTLYPEARCVHVYRHPYDNLAAVNSKAHLGESMERRYWLGTSLGNAKRIRWMWDRMYQQVEQGVPVIGVRLEWLVDEPRVMLRWLCEQLELRFHPRMLKPIEPARLLPRREGLTTQQREEAGPYLDPVVRWQGYL